MAGQRRAELLGRTDKLLADVSGQGTIFSNAVGERLGLSSTEIETLGVLAEGALPAGEIARRTGLTTGAVTRLIDRLAADGWVVRRGDPADRRRVLVEQTAAARKRSGPYFAPMARAAGEVLASYSDKELELIFRFLERMREMGLAQTERVLAMPETTPARRKHVDLRARVLGQNIRVRM